MWIDCHITRSDMGQFNVTFSRCHNWHFSRIRKIKRKLCAECVLDHMKLFLTVVQGWAQPDNRNWKIRTVFTVSTEKFPVGSGWKASVFRFRFSRFKWEFFGGSGCNVEKLRFFPVKPENMRAVSPVLEPALGSLL